MISILKAKEQDVEVLAGIGKTSFVESHGHSAKAEEINRYVEEKYTAEVLKEELRDLKNIYHIIYYADQPAGYSKIITDTPHASIRDKNVTKLERLYLLKEFYGLKLGAELFSWNLELSRSNNQAGMWLYVWKENHRAVEFYKKNGFKIIGSYDFNLTATHSNPNYHMFHEFKGD